MSTLRCSCKQLLMPAGEENIHPSTWSCDIQYWPSITNLLEENYNIGSAVACSWKHCHCHPKGPYYRDWVHIGTFLAFWVPIGSLFIFQGPYFQCFGSIHAKNVNSVCLHVYSSELTSVCLHVYRSELTWFVCDNFLHCYYTNMLWSDASQVILLANFVFFLCVKFHKSLFWVPILAAGGPYWVPISQKVGSLLGPYFKAWGSL